MKYFIDTEFHEGFHKPLFGKNRHFIDLISIGIVAEDGSEYYAISKDFDIKAAWNAHEVIPFLTSKNHSTNDRREYWLRENVLKPIFEELHHRFVREDDYKGSVDMKFNYDNFQYLIKKYGKSNNHIADEIKNFINTENFKDGGQLILGKFFPNKKPEPEFYGYYCDYDWVVFCSLFGKMINLPEGFPMYCKDLKQMLDTEAERGLKNSVTNEWEPVFKGGPLVNKNIPVFQNIKQVLDRIKANPNYPKQTDEHNALADAKWNKELFEFLKNL